MIDPRISLAAQAPKASQAISIYENALLNSTNRDLAKNRDARAATQAGLQNQVTQNTINNQPLQNELLQQTVDSNQLALDQARDNKRLVSVADFATKLIPQLEADIAAGDTTKTQVALTNRLSMLEAAKANDPELDSTETQEGLALLKQNPQELLGMLNSYVELATNKGLYGGNDRVTSSKILEDGTTIQSMSRSGTKVYSPSGQLLTGNDRKVALDNALQTKVDQKGNIAKVVSDVKVEEAQRLESETQAGRLDVESKRLNIDETKITNEQKRQDAINTKKMRWEEASSAVNTIDALLENNNFSAGFGKITTYTPDMAKSQDSIDVIAQVDQIKGLLTLESRNKLKGQGQISDGESKMLEKSATILNNPLISDELARKELIKVKRIFEDSRERNRLKESTKKKQQDDNDPLGLGL